MKAYIVSHRYYDYSGVVFAESNCKAKAYALHSDIYGDDVEYTDIRARRIPVLDKYYHNRRQMDWYGLEDRLVMVKEAGFECSDEMYDISDCITCIANQFCGRWERECNGNEKHERIRQAVQRRL